MRTRSDTVLLLEARPFVDSLYAGVLNQLGYWQLLYANYGDTPAFAVGTAAADAVVAVWLDDRIGVDRFARAVANATSFPRVRGALIVSPFSTEINARQLARSGARAWARPPVSSRELGARLSCLLHGDRRLGGERRVVADRRREPLYPVAVPA